VSDRHWLASYGIIPAEIDANAYPSVLHLMDAAIAQMIRAASVAQRKLDAGGGASAFLRAKIATARFYADQEQIRVRGLADATIYAAPSTMALAETDF